jgi:Protein of unknown function (DUF3618)
MTRTQRDQETAAGAVADDPQALRAQIEQTRAELGDTVEALAARADVRARVRERLAAISARTRRTAAEAAGAVRTRVAGLTARRRGRRP